MLLRRCAWHVKYFGRSLVIAVVARDGHGVQYTDGICPACAARFREEHEGRTR